MCSKLATTLSIEDYHSLSLELPLCEILIKFDLQIHILTLIL
jgi:hypothetical protein